MAEQTKTRCDGCGCTPCRWAIPCGSRARRRDVAASHNALRAGPFAGVEHDPTSAAFLQDDPLAAIRRYPEVLGVDLGTGESRSSVVLHVPAELSTVAISAVELIADRDAAGQAKFGASMDRSDLKPGAWLRHAIEKNADALQYQIRLARDLDQLVRKAFEAGRQSVLSGLGTGDYAHYSEEGADEVEDVVKELLG